MGKSFATSAAWVVRSIRNCAVYWTFGLRAILCGRSIKSRSSHLCGQLFVVTARFDSLHFAPIRASTVLRAEFSIRSNSRSAQFLELQR